MRDSGLDGLGSLPFLRRSYMASPMKGQERRVQAVGQTYADPRGNGGLLETAGDS
jgi:hypothetical protein